jgi:hypothetical protein
MKFKMLHKTCIALILYVGFGLSGANATILTIDWTGECDDCQSETGPNTVPLDAMDDSFYQTVTGQLILSYTGSVEEQITLTKENFVSFYYGGSNILDPLKITAEHFTENTEFSTTIIMQSDGTPSIDGFKLKNFLAPQWIITPEEGLELFDLSFGYLPDTIISSADWSIAEQVETAQHLIDNEVVDHTCPKGSFFSTWLGACKTIVVDFSPGFRDVGEGSLFTVRDGSTDVPEPTSLAIFALGIMGLASRRFKKQS